MSGSKLLVLLHNMPRKILLQLYATISVLFFLICIQPIQASTVPDLIRAAASDQGIPPALLAAIMQNESGFNPNLISSSGCAGLGQLCKKSAHRPHITVQCSQDRANGPQLCSPNCDTSDSDYNWCDSCTGSFDEIGIISMLVCVVDSFCFFSARKNVVLCRLILKNNNRAQQKISIHIADSWCFVRGDDCILEVDFDNVIRSFVCNKETIICLIN
jgi:hypothetical protein